MDRYASFKGLARNERRGADYRIRWRIGTSGIAILSIHGGRIEPGTSRIADAIAGQEHTFYSFEGMKTIGNRDLHITSTRFDEPTAVEIVCQSAIILSIHGCSSMEPVVLLGGLDFEIRDRIRRELLQSGFQATDAPDPSVSGTDQANICNLCGRGMGVQLEINRGLRELLFGRLDNEGASHPADPDLLSRFASAVRKAIEPFADVAPENEWLQGTD